MSPDRAVDTRRSPWLASSRSPQQIYSPAPRGRQAVPLDWRASMFSVTTSLRGWADTELAIALISASLGFTVSGQDSAGRSRPGRDHRNGRYLGDKPVVL